MKPSFAVLFDLDDTLINRQALIPSELQHLDGRGYAPRQPFFEAWLTPMDQERFTHWLCAQLRPDPELLALLRTLEKKALVSNGGGKTQRAKLRAAGLDQIFPPEHIHISGELPWAKPDPRIFAHACYRLDIEPQRCLYLGDHLEIDGVGAREAGLTFVHVEQALTAQRLEQVLSHSKQIRTL